MSISMIVLASIGLSFSGFGVSKNTSAPSGNDIVAYSPARADFMIYLDVSAVAPNNWRAAKQLVASREISQIPELARELRQAIQQIEMGLGMAKGAVGVDPINDVKQIAAWVSFPRKGDPNLLVHVRGRFPGDLVEKIAAATQRTVTKVGGRSALRLDKGALLATAPDGSVVFGTPALVSRIATRGPRTRTPARGTAGARAAALLDAKPFFAFVSSPSRTALVRLKREMSDMNDNAFADLVSGHTFAGFIMRHDGVGWTYTARSRSGVARAKLASKGLLSLMRAAHYGARGLANLFFAAVDSYKGKEKALDAIIRSKGELLKLVESFTGDGKFRERIVVTGRTVSVDATGRSLSDVMPVTGALPVLGAAFFLVASRQVKAPLSAPAVSSPPPRKRR